jgi:hypothetical protein
MGLQHAVSQLVRLGVQPPQGLSDFGCSQDSCGFIYDGASSLSRGRVCHITGHSPCLCQAIYMDDLEFESWQGLGIFLFIAFRSALGLAQSPIQWVLRALSLGVKRPGRKADHLPPSSAEVKE